LGRIAEEATLKSLEAMVSKKVELVVEGESEEHEYLLSARPLIWAVDIDGEILINDTSDLSIEYGKVYEANITELVGDQLLATLVKQV
jgi:tRNA A37 methylthiotransferase MiaB